MSDIKQTVTRTDEQGVSATGAPVEQQTKRIQTESAAEPKTVLQNIIWYIVGTVEILLALRFVLKLFGANPASSFVVFIYNVTGVLTAPFDSIFGVTHATAGQTHSIFEPSILVAAAVYLLIGWGIVKFITINHKD